MKHEEVLRKKASELRELNEKFKLRAPKKNKSLRKSTINKFQSGGEFERPPSFNTITSKWHKSIMIFSFISIVFLPLYAYFTFFISIESFYSIFFYYAILASALITYYICLKDFFWYLKRDKTKKRRIQRILITPLAPFIIFFWFWISFSKGVPAILHLFANDAYEEIYHIKNKYHCTGRCSCEYQLSFEEEVHNYILNSACVLKKDWVQLSKHDAMMVIGSRSIFGIELNSFERL